MKKIVFFNDTLQYGGSEILLVNLLNYLSQENQYIITLILPYPSKNNVLIEKISNKIQICYLHREMPDRRMRIFYENLISFFPRIYLKLLKVNLDEFDIVICFKDCMYSKVFSTSKKRNILWIHNLPTINNYQIANTKEYIPVMLLKKRVSRLIKSYSKFNDVVCVSNICKTRYIDIFNKGVKPKQNIHVISNAIDTLSILRQTEISQNTDQIEKYTFIAVTRLSHEKRLDRIIKASAKLKDEGYRFTVAIIGNGIMEKELEKEIKENSLEEEIKMLGYKNNPYPYIKNSDWLICSSEKESFSLVILESIYLGTSVISTECGGPNEILDDGKYGILTSNNTEGIYWGMKKALDNPELKAAYQSKSTTLLDNYNYNKWLKTIVNLIYRDAN